MVAKCQANAGFKRGIAGRLFFGWRRDGSEGEIPPAWKQSKILPPVVARVGQHQRSGKNQGNRPKIFRRKKSM